ncbi:MAG: hypothetical protein ABI579_02095 [Candidatus Sumerlaeota bacterium]
MGFRPLDCVLDGNDPDLLAVGVDQANFFCADLMIGPRVIWLGSDVAPPNP